ncbi:AAA family ATPase [Pararhizobium gei]|uniref:AAA family ATPase n=1 Tax=Pararhizobium gei TaxID=1395951 RepID=UPI0023DC40C5|nr:AAA family ATPase [Rhizobium gei]
MKPRQEYDPFTPGWRQPKPAMAWRSPDLFEARGPKQFVIDGLVALDELSVVYGDPDAGKGNFALNMAMAAATAQPWFGRNAGMLQSNGEWWPAGVVYFALERPAQVERRIYAYRQEREIEFEPAIAVCEEVFDIRDPDAGELIAETMFDARKGTYMCTDPSGVGVCDYQPDFNLAIIDTLAMALQDGSDSDPRDMGAALRSLHTARRLTGSHIMLIHHSPVSGDDRMRGYGSLNAAIDMSIHVANKRGQRIASVKKNSDNPDRPKFYYSLKSFDTKLWDDEEGDYIGTAPSPVLVEEAGPKEVAAKAKVAAAAPAASASEKPVLDALASIDQPATEAAWREAFDGFRDADITAGAHRKRFSVGKPKLESKGLISKDENEMWTVTALPTV